MEIIKDIQLSSRHYFSMVLMTVIVSFLLLAVSSINIAYAKANPPAVPEWSRSPESEPRQVYIDFSKLPAAPPPGPFIEVPEGSPGEGSNFIPSLFGKPDPLFQEGLQELDLFDLSDSHALLSAPIVNFEGMARGSPQDIVGDVGPNHYIQMINATRFQIWDKQGNSLAGPIVLDTLWITAAAGDPTFQPQCQGQNTGDPIVVYDHLSDRWLISQFARPNHMCIAISQTPNPVAGTWNLYQFNTTNFPDYPKFGVWPDGYYMTAHEGTQAMYVFDRANMVSGNPASFIKFSVAGDIGCPRGSRILPGDLDGPLPPVGSPGFFLRAQENCQSGAPDRLQIYSVSPNWQPAGLTLLVGPQNIPTANFTLMQCNIGGGGVRACIRQPDGGTQLIDALTGRPMMQLKYRNFANHETLVVNETVQVGGGGLTNNAGIRWWELRRTPAGSGNWSIFQEGTYAPQTAPAPTNNTWVSRWMGSIAMDRNGNMALGYSITNGDQTNPIFPGIRYTGRLASDPLGLMPQGEETIIAGAGTQTGTLRWGDYSALSVDPVDDCTFWYTQTYINALGNGRSRIASFSFPSCSGTDLEISKSANPDPATAGGQLFYTVTVTNNGPQDATNVVVVDTLPAGVTYQTDTDSCTELPLGSGSFTCDLGDIANGDSFSFDIVVLVDSNLTVNGPATVTNVAIVSADQSDLDESNNEVSITTIISEWADLKVTKDCKPDDPILAGGTATCTIYVDNLGVSTARDVKLVDTHISDGNFLLSNITTSQGVCAQGPAGIITCNNLGNIGAGERVTVTVDVSSNEAANVNDIAVVSSPTPDPDTSNNQDEDSVTFRAEADLALTKSDLPDPVVAGTQLTYTLVVTNNGPSSAVNVLVEDVLPSSVSIDSVDVTIGIGSCNAGEPGNFALPTTCTFDSLASGASSTMEIVVTVLPDTTGSLHNDAKVSSDTLDEDNSNNLVTEVTTINSSADMAIEKTVGAPLGGGPVNAGDPLTYVLRVTNNGPSTAIGAMVHDMLPAYVEFVNFTILEGSGACDVLPDPEPKFVCELGNFDPGDEFVVTIETKVKPDVPKDTLINNEASVNAQTNDPDGQNNSDSVSIGVGTQADLWLVKTGKVLTGNSSGTVEYLLTVHNDGPACSPDDSQQCGNGGPSDAQNLVVVDTLPLTPKKFVFEFASLGCSYDKPTHKVTCNQAVLKYGETVTFLIQGTFRGSVGDVTNTATVTSTTPDPDAVNDTHSSTQSIKGGKGNKGGRP